MVLPDATLRFLAAVESDGVSIAPLEFPAGTKTAKDAADAIGCHVSQIVKSLVFLADDVAVLVLVPGNRRLDTARLAVAADADSVRRASLDEVRTATGYAAGGTPPFGHAERLPTYADIELHHHAELWAAAGTPTTVFPIAPDELERIARPIWVDVVEREGR